MRLHRGGKFLAKFQKLSTGGMVAKGQQISGNFPWDVTLGNFVNAELCETPHKLSVMAKKKTNCMNNTTQNTTYKQRV